MALPVQVGFPHTGLGSPALVEHSSPLPVPSQFLPVLSQFPPAQCYLPVPPHPSYWAILVWPGSLNAPPGDGATGGGGRCLGPGGACLGSAPACSRGPAQWQGRWLAIGRRGGQVANGKPVAMAGSAGRQRWRVERPLCSPRPPPIPAAAAVFTLGPTDGSRSGSAWGRLSCSLWALLTAVDGGTY